MTETGRNEPIAADRRELPPPGTRWYWAERVDRAAGQVWIDPEETRHLRTVLRHRRADPIDVIDGQGGRFTVALRSEIPPPGRGARAHGLEARILAVHPPVPPPPPILLSVPCIKWSRLETLVDGAVQLGVTQFLLWQAERANWQAELTPSRRVRLERIVRAATTQSLGTHVPAIQGPLELPALLSALDPLAPGAIWVAHGPRTDFEPPVSDSGGEPSSPARSAGLALVIGPEGGLTPSEVTSCLRAGARILALGPRRLRTEVAAVAGLAALLDRSRA